MHPLLNIAVRAARRAGEVIARSIPRLEGIEIHAKDRHDYVTEVDRAAEQEIIGIIRQHYPAHAILAEESGASGENEARWIIDPLDGTTNFLHGFPVYAVSIACEVRGRLEVATVYDVLRQELFTATRGVGAQLDNRKIRVSKRRSLDGALLATGFPFRANVDLDNYLQMLRVVMPQVAGVRRPGSAALDLAYVAAGRVDGFWELGLQPWDTAAGALLITEAGGHISRINGEPYEHGDDVCAGTPRVHAALLAAFAPLVSAPTAGVESRTTLRARGK
ncbi:MAG TPA: inositol monophosphatase family protein [Steroidobacteraceae bacterium]|nr:inositol monophosphatase family protein [Steroidobacteraceae bacterium]